MLILLINEDILPVVPIMIYSIHCTAKPDILDTPSDMGIMIASCIVMVGGIIGHFVLYKPRLKLQKMTIPLALVSMALFIGGIGTISKENYLGGLTYVITLGILMLFLYVFIMMYLCPPKTADVKKYTCFTIFALGLVIFAQAITLMIRLDLPIDELMRNVLVCGWGNRSTLTMTIMISIPFCFYLAYQSKKAMALFYYLIAFMEYSIVYIMVARAGMIFSTFTLLCSIIYTLIKGKNRSQLLYAMGITGLIFGTLILVENQPVLDMIARFKNIIETSDSTGRVELFQLGKKVFLEHPIFGAGVGYIGNVNNSKPPYGMYWFHNTIIQVAANMGIVGLICYGYWYIKRAMVMFHNASNFNVILSIAILGFELQNLMDASTFTPFPYVFMILFLTIMLEYNNQYETPLLKPRKKKLKQINAVA